MYNYELLKDEQVEKIFDNILIEQNDNERETTLIVTNKRILFLDYLDDPSSPNEVLRVSSLVQYPRYKELYHHINIDDIARVESENKYRLILKDNFFFEFTNQELYSLLKELIKNN